MKDVISILQSRIAKRQNALALFERAQIYNHYFWHAVGQQKLDKRILAEIVRLRRELKERDVILDRFYRAEEI